MIRLKLTDSTEADFVELVRQLDGALAVRRQDHSFYSQFNRIDQIKHVIVAYEEERAASLTSNSTSRFFLHRRLAASPQ